MREGVERKKGSLLKRGKRGAGFQKVEVFFGKKRGWVFQTSADSKKGEKIKKPFNRPDLRQINSQSGAKG